MDILGTDKKEPNEVYLKSITSTFGCFVVSNLKKVSAGAGDNCLIFFNIMVTLFPSLPKEVTFWIEEVAGLTHIPILVKFRSVLVGNNSI